MLISRLGPRAISQTLATRLDRYTAAWPAELPAPTSPTSLAGAQPRLQWRRPIMHRRALEIGEIVDLETAVLCPACDDDGTRSDPLRVGQREQKASAIPKLVWACKSVHFVGDRHVGAEFLGLVIGAPHQGHAGDARWESQDNSRSAPTRPLDRRKRGNPAPALIGPRRLHKPTRRGPQARRRR